MAAVNYYIGLKRGDGMNPGRVVANNASAGTAVDVEVRMQIDNGTNLTGLTRLDVETLLTALTGFVRSNGNGGAYLPVK